MLNLDKTTWQQVRFGDVVRHLTDRVNPEDSGLSRFLAGGHIPSEQLSITEWGEIGRDQMGPMFYKRFQPGHVLYVSRRTYLKKVSVPDFSGITGEKTFVLESKNSHLLLQEFLPLLMSSENFHSYAIASSRGSVNPYLNWRELENYTFELPPLDEQKQIAELLWAVENYADSIRTTINSAIEAASRLRALLIGELPRKTTAAKAFNITIGRQRSPKHEVGEHLCKYLRSANITTEGIQTEDVKSMNFTPDEQSKYALLRGDVLVTEGSASTSAVGLPAVWNEEIADTVCFQNTLLRYRYIPGVSLPDYVAQWCRWAFESGEFLRASSGTNISHIGSRSASQMEAALPDLADQQRIADRLNMIDKAVEASKEEALMLRSLRSSLLLTVFGGS